MAYCGLAIKTGLFVWFKLFNIPLDFSGKKVMAVMTHEGSGIGSCEKDLKKFCTGVTFRKGLAVHGAEVKESESTVAAWAKKMV